MFYSNSFNRSNKGPNTMSFNLTLIAQDCSLFDQWRNSGRIYIFFKAFLEGDKDQFFDLPEV